MRAWALLLVGLALVAAPARAEPYACTNCNEIEQRLQDFCRYVVTDGQPCAAYKMVWRRLCRRTCLAVNRMKCTDQLKVCLEDPDCPMLCKLFFDHMCPRVEDARNLLSKGLILAEDPCPGTPLY